MSHPPPDRSPGTPRDLGVLLFAMALPSIMSWLEFWILPSDSAEPDSTLAVVFALGKIFQFTFPVFYVWCCDRARLRPQRPSARGIGIGVGFAALVAAGAFILYFAFLKNSDVFGATPAKIHLWLTKMHAGTPQGFIAMAASVSVLHSFLEEYYWRWFVFGELQRWVPWSLAVAISSLAFMAHHVLVLAYYLPAHFWIAAVPFSLCVACGGAVWAWLYHTSRSLYAPWISHLLVDSAIMIVGYDMLAPYW